MPIAICSSILQSIQIVGIVRSQFPMLPNATILKCTEMQGNGQNKYRMLGWIPHYLKQYVFPFFLGIKECNNLNNWPLFYGEFLPYLETVPKVKGKGKIAYSTMNHCISALNTFMRVMKRKNLVATLEKCEKFPSHLLNKRTLDDVLTDSEKSIIFQELVKLDQDAADFFLFLLATGMRLSEGMGISIADVMEGEPDHKTLRVLLGGFGLKPYGTVVLCSQVKKASHPRSIQGHVARKPLKGRKTMKPEDGRIIPILEKGVYNNVALRYQKQTELHKQRKYGTDENDYLLFDGIASGKFWKQLEKA